MSTAPILESLRELVFVSELVNQFGLEAIGGVDRRLVNQSLYRGRVQVTFIRYLPDDLTKQVTDQCLVVPELRFSKFLVREDVERGLIFADCTDIRFDAEPVQRSAPEELPQSDPDQIQLAARHQRDIIRGRGDQVGQIAGVALTRGFDVGSGPLAAFAKLLDLRGN